jgi:hypothetical protein
MISDNEYSCSIKNGDTVIFKSDLPSDEVKSLPTFPNQHQLFSYFQTIPIIIFN